MAHFSERAWVDFARGTEACGTRREMDAHLAAACSECKSALDLWGRIVRLTAKEKDYAPPECLIRLVKTTFSTGVSAEVEGWTIASLLFDSAFTPLPIGIRGGMANTRQRVYEGEGLTVDVRFERREHSNTISASGQVLDKEVPLRWLGKAGIVLWNDKGQLVAKTEAGDHGEFQFEFELQDQLQISIVTANRRTLRIALGNLE